MTLHPKGPLREVRHRRMKQQAPNIGRAFKWQETLTCGHVVSRPYRQSDQPERRRCVKCGPCVDCGLKQRRPGWDRCTECLQRRLRWLESKSP